MPILRRAALAAMLPVLLATGTGAKKEKSSDLLLPDGFPPITQEERDLKEVPYAKGAPAAVLLDAQQTAVQWYTDRVRQMIHHYRRVKILTEAGKERFADFRSPTFIGKWRVHKVEARTILPDGTVVEAKEGENVFRDKSRSDLVKVVRVTWPRVEVGAILDLHLSYAVDGIGPDRWILQERIPVLESRYGLIIPPGFQFRTAAVRVPQEQAQPISFRHAMGMDGEAGSGSPLSPEGYAYEKETSYRLTSTANVWRFRNLEPIPEEPHQPPVADISQALLIIPQSFKSQAQFYEIASDWKGYSKREKEDLDAWQRKGSAAAQALAQRICEGKTSTLEKTEAVRRAVRERARLDEVTPYRYWEGPDDVLEKGYGTSADLAGLAVVMLRAVGIQADLEHIRRRSDGILPTDFPLPALFTDALVRVKTEAEPLHFSPTEDLPVGKLPWDCRGVWAIPLDGVAEAPVLIPDYKSSENKSLRVVNAFVNPATGTLAAESTQTYDGVAAERWRQRLRPLDEAARKETIREDLRRWLPGADLTGVELEELDHDAKSLVVRAKWQVEGYATVAGKRLVVNPNLLGRVHPADWAASERRFDVDLGEAGEVTDVVVLKLPEFFKEVNLPQRALMNAAPVGRYEISYERQPRAVVVRRNMTLDVYRFPPNSYTGLKKWLGDVAASDDRPVVIALP